MKARRKGTKEFKEIGTVTFVDDNWRVFQVEDLEFEQGSNLTPDYGQDLRERAAIAAMQSMIPTQKGQYSMCDAYKKYNDCAEEAIRYADALVEKLKG